ncbi:hypothetical protein B0H13DRAFT_1854705 [Mycena leptocephala]|nr:hypothetical protein B0H13DRAFT_1854705 [Mycena leptocephala]
MGSGSKNTRSKKPRPSLITLDFDQLRDMLALGQEPSAAMKEAKEASAPSARFILTRNATKELARSPAGPALPPDASLVSPPKSPRTPPSPKRPHTPAAQLRVFVQQTAPASTNPFAPLSDAPGTDLATDSDSNIKVRSDSAQSFDDLAATFKDLVRLMRDYKSSSPTAACFSAFDALQMRLEKYGLVRMTPIGANWPSLPWNQAAAAVPRFHCVLDPPIIMRFSMKFGGVHAFSGAARIRDNAGTLQQNFRPYPVLRLLGKFSYTSAIPSEEGEIQFLVQFDQRKVTAFESVKCRGTVAPF